MDDESRLVEPISERHEKQHGQDGWPDKLQKIDVGPQILVVMVHIFVPAGIGYVKSTWIGRKRKQTEKELS